MKAKQILAAILAGTMVIGCLSGCSKSKETVTYEVTKKNVRPEIEETKFDFIKDGTCDYQIVCPAEPTDNETFAAEELQYFIEGATQVKLPVVNESDNLGEGKYLFVGATKAAEEAGVNPTYDEVKYNGFVLKQIDDDVYLRGYSDIGTRNSVYEFLGYAFNYEYYAADEIRLDETKNAKLLAYDEIVTPDFDWRMSSLGESIFNPTIGYRMRTNPGDEIFTTGLLVHNSFAIIDPSEYGWKSEKYQEWYSDVTWVKENVEVPCQLCYSNEEMRQEYVKNLIGLIEKSSATSMILGMEDNLEWCTCEACSAAKEKYGTDAAVMVHFINKVQADVDVWFDANRPGETPTKLVMFAYYKTVSPPAKYNEAKDAWEPIDDSVIVNDHSAVMFAPIQAEYDIPFTATDKKSVADPYGQVLGWASVSKNLYSWVYTLLPQSGLLYFDTLEVMQDNLKFMLENGTIMIYDQSDSYQENRNTGFARLKGYVMSKLQWDTSLNMQELMDDFFVNYFEDASDTMEELYTQEREWLTHIYADTDASGKIGEDLVNDKYWSHNQLQSYLALINQAYADIEPLREKNPERYAVLYDRILTESLQFRYLDLQLFFTEYGEAKLLDARNEFKNDFERLGLISYREGEKIGTLWDDWGLD